MVTFDYKKTPITQIADYIILYSAKIGASDMHFDPRENGLMVRIRIDGDLQDYTLIPPEYERNLVTRLKLLANMNITETRLPQDGAIKGTFGNMYLDMRVSSLPANKGEKIVIRILDYSRSLNGIESLGFSKENFKKLKRMIEVPNGILLVTGATGSGKSTTTYSVLEYLNKPEVNIITVEDPVEMQLDGLNQVQVNSEIGLTFANVLRSILRQDPNIILIGEIRDSETAQIAIRASITGHFVISTIHTNDALSTVERLLDMDVERYLLSTALTGIISQRLVKTVCKKCRIKRETTPYEKKVFKTVLNKDIDYIYDANKDGCDECRHGYKGRIAVHEVLELDDKIRDALNDENMEKDDLRELVYTHNVITMLQDGLNKVLDEKTSFDEIYRVVEIPNDIEETYSYMHKKNNENNDKEKKTKNKDNQIESTTIDNVNIEDTNDINFNPNIENIEIKNIDDNPIELPSTPQNISNDTATLIVNSSKAISLDNQNTNETGSNMTSKDKAQSAINNDLNNSSIPVISPPSISVKLEEEKNTSNDSEKSSTPVITESHIINDLN